MPLPSYWGMRKQFAFEQGNHKPARVVELIKSEIRKYVKRERRKKLPEDADYWDFECKTGRSEAEAKPVHEKEIFKEIDAAVANGWQQIYIEVIAAAAQRAKKAEPPSD